MVENENTPSASRTARLLGALPTVLILAVLGGIAVVGHATGWTLPKFSVLTGNGGTPDDWCPAHSVPESMCVECNPELLPKGKSFGWCGKHGVAECPLCHPEVAQLPKPPVITAADLERADKAFAFSDRPENDHRCKLHERRIQFVSDEAMRKAGIRDEPAAPQLMVEFAAANGEIGYDQMHLARLSSRSAGTVWRVLKQVGEQVSKDEVLALVDSAEVGKAKAEFMQAFAQVDVKQQLWQNLQSAGQAVSFRAVQEAEAALREARIRLLSAQQALVNLGLPIRADELKKLSDEQLATFVQFLGLPDSANLDSRTTTANLLPIRSTIDGVVVTQQVVPGEAVDSMKLLFMVADTSRMWLNLNVRIEDAKRIQKGQKVVFKPDGGKQELTGTVAWISTAVDERTRTVPLRAELANADGKLRAGTFGAGRVILREEPQAVVIPTDALHHDGCCHIVFVRDKNYLKPGAAKVFHVRKVVPGARDDTKVEIISGVLPGEVVASKGSGVMRAELLKNNLGAG